MSLDWQPIETAPRDGEPLDLWVVHAVLGRQFGRIERDARWVRDEIGETWLSSGRLGLDWEIPEGEEDGPESCRPTHWRRIPKTGPNGERDGAMIRPPGDANADAR